MVAVALLLDDICEDADSCLFGIGLVATVMGGRYRSVIGTAEFVGVPIDCEEGFSAFGVVVFEWESLPPAGALETDDASSGVFQRYCELLSSRILLTRVLGAEYGSVGGLEETRGKYTDSERSATRMGGWLEFGMTWLRFESRQSIGARPRKNTYP